MRCTGLPEGRPVAQQDGRIEQGRGAELLYVGKIGLFGVLLFGSYESRLLDSPLQCQAGIAAQAGFVEPFLLLVLQAVVCLASSQHIVVGRIDVVLRVFFSKKKLRQYQPGGCIEAVFGDAALQHLPGFLVAAFFHQVKGPACLPHAGKGIQQKEYR